MDLLPEREVSQEKTRLVDPLQRQTGYDGTETGPAVAAAPIIINQFQALMKRAEHCPGTKLELQNFFKSHHSTIASFGHTDDKKGPFGSMNERLTWFYKIFGVVSPAIMVLICGLPIVLCFWSPQFVPVVLLSVQNFANWVNGKSIDVNMEEFKTENKNELAEVKHNIASLTKSSSEVASNLTQLIEDYNARVDDPGARPRNPISPLEENFSVKKN